MSEREIIRKLRESARTAHLENRLFEAASPIDVFLNQLAGTLNRIEKVNKKYNSLEQQKVLEDYIISHLRFLHLNSDVIRTILETPAEETTGINVKDYLFESESGETDSTYRIDEARSPMEMFFTEFDELYNRAKVVQSRYNSPEQSKEFEDIVMDRLDYIRRAEKLILTILEKDPEEEVSAIVKQFKSKFVYSKAKQLKKVAATSQVDDDIPPVDDESLIDNP